MSNGNTATTLPLNSHDTALACATTLACIGYLYSDISLKDVLQWYE